MHARNLTKCRIPGDRYAIKEISTRKFPREGETAQNAVVHHHADGRGLSLREARVVRLQRLDEARTAHEMQFLARRDVTEEVHAFRIGINALQRADIELIADVCRKGIVRERIRECRDI